MNGTKTAEIRNFNCRAVQPKGHFYVLRVNKGQRNMKGQPVLDVVCKGMFLGNHFIPHNAFDSFFEDHQVSPEAYAAMRRGWASDKGGVVAWKMELVEIYNPPKYLPHRGQDSGTCKAMHGLTVCRWHFLLTCQLQPIVCLDEKEPIMTGSCKGGRGLVAVHV